MSTRFTTWIATDQRKTDAYNQAFENRTVLIKAKTPLSISPKGFLVKNGGDLLSHTVSHAVPSALKSLTSVFGMGTGGTSSL